MTSVQHPHLSAEETARLGDEIYEQQIRLLVEAGSRGKIVAIDVETGAYALEETALAASRRLQAQRPATEVWFVRVGHRALHKTGARSLLPQAHDQEGAMNRALTAFSHAREGGDLLYHSPAVQGRGVRSLNERRCRHRA